MKKIVKDRFVLLGLCFIVFGVIIILQLVDVQIVRGKEFSDRTRYQLLKGRTVPAERGKIYDRNGVPIAVNDQSFVVHIAKADLKNDQFNEMILQLANIFEKNGDKYNNSFSEYLKFNPLSFNENKTSAQIKKWQMDKELFKLPEAEVKVDPSEFLQYLRKDEFKIADHYTDEEAYKIISLRYEIKKSQWLFDSGSTICLAKGVDTATIAEIEEKNHIFKGLITDIEPVRRYIDDEYVAHVLGFIRVVDQNDYPYWKEYGYGPNDLVGKQGIELAAERYLRGIDGTVKVEIDSSKRLADESYSVPAIPGNDVILTIDMELQKAAMESLERNILAIKARKGEDKYFGDANAGAAVAIDVRTGEILALASYPTFNPAGFLPNADPEARKKAIEANTAEGSPMFNRTLRGTYIPGSIYKPITGIAALESGVITPNTLIIDEVKFNRWGRDWKCLEGGHPPQNLEKALATSCNVFFYKVGVDTTIDNIDIWAKHFGLGEYTGIEIENEAKGYRSNKETKEKLYKNRADQLWYPANTAMSAIGQGDNSFTPLQIANYIATLANGGKRFKPHLLKRVIKYDGSIVNEIQPEYEQIPVQPENIKAVQKGMEAVANSQDGTAFSRFKDFPVKVAGKTGTPETGREKYGESSNGLFVCYAPADDPQIAVAVVIEHGVWGSNAAPVAKDILAAYFDVDQNTSVGSAIISDVPVLTR